MAALVRPHSVSAERLISHSTASSRQTATTSPHACPAASTGVMRWQQRARRRQHQLQITSTYPTPETEKERSPIDFPQEWITPQPSRRPDIFPEFEKQQTPLPKPMPGDPEVPDEEEEEEEEKKKKEDPDKEEEEKDPNQPEPSPE